MEYFENAKRLGEDSCWLPSKSTFLMVGPAPLHETARIGRRRKEGSRRTRFREARRLQPLHDRLLDQGQGRVRCHMMCAVLLCEQSLRADLGCPSMSRSG